MKNILVTGGAGFIGSYFLNKFVKSDLENNYICLDLMTYAANLNNLSDILNCNNFKFVKGDIADKSFVFNFFNDHKIDVVVNFAAETHVDNSIGESDVFYKTNVMGVKVLLDACLHYGIKRFHQVSTDEVYGNNCNSFYFDEESKLNPSSPYSSSKAAADLLIISYFKTYSIPVSISRCCNNFGPNQNIEKFIPNAISKAINNRCVQIYGDGNNVREWIHVEDHCNAIKSILDFGKEGEIYNVGSGLYLSNNELVKIILDTLKKDYTLIEYVKDRLGHDKKYGLNYNKIKGICDWVAECSDLSEIINTINCYIEKNKF